MVLLVSLLHLAGSIYTLGEGRAVTSPKVDGSTTPAPSSTCYGEYDIMIHLYWNADCRVYIDSGTPCALMSKSTIVGPAQF